MKETVEVYKQSTGELIDTYEQDVPEEAIDLTEEIASLKARVLKLEKP